MENGLPQSLCENVEVKENGKVYVKGLENHLCHELVKNISGQKFNNRYLICNGIIPVTPYKDQQNTTVNSDGVSFVNNNEVSVSAPPQSDQVSIAELEETVLEVASEQPPEIGSNESMQPPGPYQQLERRKSVRDLVTDFSSCLSSPEEETTGDLVETITRRKKKKRKASTSPIVDSSVKGANQIPSK